MVLFLTNSDAGMKPTFLLLLFFLAATALFAQQPDTATGKMIVHSDYRLQVLGKRISDINTSILKSQARTAEGYRLMILNTNDRAYALKVRSDLLQRYPDQKPYMWYSNPYIKLKFGNFKTREEADSYRKEISQMLDGASIYLLSETIEVKPDKDFDPDELYR